MIMAEFDSRLRKGKMCHYASINSRHTDRITDVTVAELKQWLAQWPDTATVNGYEGELGSWIRVKWETPAPESAEYGSAA